MAEASSGNWQVLFDTYMSNQGGITLQESSKQAVEVFGSALAAAIRLCNHKPSSAAGAIGSF